MAQTRRTYSPQGIRASSLINEKYTSLITISSQPVVILEIGRNLSKVGYSGEAAPRAIISTPPELYCKLEKRYKSIKRGLNSG